MWTATSCMFRQGRGATGGCGMNQRLPRASIRTKQGCTPASVEDHWHCAQQAINNRWARAWNCTRIGSEECRACRASCLWGGQRLRRRLSCLADRVPSGQLTRLTPLLFPKTLVNNKSDNLKFSVYVNQPPVTRSPDTSCRTTLESKQ